MKLYPVVQTISLQSWEREQKKVFFKFIYPRENEWFLPWFQEKEIFEWHFYYWP